MNQYLLNNLLLGLPTMVACLLLQAGLISAAIRYYKQRVHRLSEKSLGPLEALNGALMIGVSTATLMTAFQGWMEGRSR
jgi:branched-subunit amino acid permease